MTDNRRAVAKAELRPEQRRAAALIAIGASDADVCAEAKIARATLTAWRRKPAFVAEVNGCVDQMQRLTIRRARSYVPDALEALHKIVTDPQATRGERTAAARVLLDRIPLRPETAIEPSVQGERTADAEISETTLLEVYQVLAEVEAGRRDRDGGRGAEPEDNDYADDEVDGEAEPALTADVEPVHRVIQGEVVHDDDGAAVARIASDRAGLGASARYLAG